MLRRIAEEGEPPLTVRLVNWADEEGARFGRSLFGSSRRRRARCATRTSCAKRADATASRCPDALASTASTSTARSTRAAQLENAAAYLELHIEQGPVLESMDLPLGVVLGTFGVERSRITWRGQAAHAGSTPMDKRRDALAGAAKLALEIRDIAAEVGDGAVCTSGGVVCKPGIVTSVVETAEQLLDQRHLDAAKLARMLELTRGGVRSASPPRRTSRSSGSGSGRSSRSSSTRRWSSSRTRRSARSRARRTGSRAGPLHDAAEVARAGVPTVMLFVQSLRGLSHTKLEDTKPEHLELSVQALDRLASKTIDWLS